MTASQWWIFSRINLRVAKNKQLARLSQVCKVWKRVLTWLQPPNSKTLSVDHNEMSSWKNCSTLLIIGTKIFDVALSKWTISFLMCQNYATLGHLPNCMTIFLFSGTYGSVWMELRNLCILWQKNQSEIPNQRITAVMIVWPSKINFSWVA